MDGKVFETNGNIKYCQGGDRYNDIINISVDSFNLQDKIKVHF